MGHNESSDIAKLKQRILNIFDKAATTYDQIGPRYFSYFGTRLVEVAQIPAGSKVLDVATGRGAVLYPAAESVGKHGQVIGIDISEAMVQETNKELQRLKTMPNVQVRQMDAENLQFPDQSFDFVLCSFAIFFFPQLDRAMSEFYRVLKPNGHICVSTFERSHYQQLGWLREIVSAYLPAKSETKPAPKSDTAIQPVFDTLEGLEEILNKPGFENIQIYSESADFFYESKEEFWSTLWTIAIRESFEKIEQEKGAEKLEKLKFDVFKKLDDLNQTTDEIHQLIPVLIGLATKP